VGKFKKVIADPQTHKSGGPEKIVLATGKMAIELAKLRESQKNENIALIRLEQLYPLPLTQLQEAMEPYRDGTPVFWCQEEPTNMGAWQYLKVHFGEGLFGRWPLKLISRPESASPSTGSKKAHKIEQQELWDLAMSNLNKKAANC